VQTCSTFNQAELEQSKLFVEEQFELAEKQSDGKTLREHLQNVQEQTGVVPKELENLIELPESMNDYWMWFLRLHNHRPAGMGLTAIPYSEMQAFFNLNGIHLDPYEIEVIELFDSIALRVLSEQADKEQKKANAKKK